MVLRIIVKTAIAGGLIAGTLLATQGPALADNCRAKFTCDFGASPYCYFVIRSYGRDKYFKVPAGGSQMLYGIQRTSRYCSSSQGYPNGDTCRQSAVKMACN